MASGSRRSKGRDVALSTLGVLIEGLTLAEGACDVPLAHSALKVACLLLKTIMNTMTNKDDYIDLGVFCGNVCDALNRGLGGRGSKRLNRPMKKAVEKLTTTMANIQRRVDEKNNRNVFSRAFNAQSDKDVIAAWKEELNGVLRIFEIELGINTNAEATETKAAVMEIRQHIREGFSSQHHASRASIPAGESPPPAPKAFFGRRRLIEEMVHHAVNLKSIALIGAGGTGKTSVALTVLHDRRIKKRFGDNRRFIRCDRFTPSRQNFLARLSKAIGAGIENPDDLASLHPFLSSKKMILFLDNAESILDPKGTDSREICAMVKELGDFSNICLGITSRITTVPPHCKRLQIPKLSTEAACDIFYSIYNNGGESDIVSNLVQQLDFHALSITLLATTASDNLWDYNRLAREWRARRTRVFQTGYDQGLGPTIELSLSSPTFHKLGTRARELLGAIAFFPQGIDHNNLEWLFPMIPKIKSIIDKFCTLSLTHRSNGFITMLAPIRDHIAPGDPRSSPLLCTVRARYFTRLSVGVDPAKPGFEEARWIISEDSNIEHLLNIFTSIDPSAGEVWDVCHYFMEHLCWHKPRKTVLGPKIERLPDSHPSKPGCLHSLSQLLGQIGNDAERKRLLIHALALERGRRNDLGVAKILIDLADANRLLRLKKEGIEQVKEALKIYERLGDTGGQIVSLNYLANSLLDDDQLDAAENAALRAIELAPEKGQEFRVCQSQRFLGKIYQKKGKKRKAILHFETAISIASSFKFHSGLFYSHYYLAELFLKEGESDKANSHIKQAKSHAVDNAYRLGRAMERQACIWSQQQRLKDAKSEISDALEIFENLGAANEAEHCRNFLRSLNKQ